MDNFREWVSDNLRYIILVACILAALIGIFFGVRALSSLTGKSRDSTGSAGSENQTAQAQSQKTSSVSSVPDAASSAESAQPGGQLLENAESDVLALVQRYYDALNNHDTAAASQCVDVMTDALSSEIEESAATYSDIRIYTKTGLVPDSYIVFAYYHYLNEGDSVQLPGLSQMLVRKGDDGVLRIVFSDLDQATSDYIDQVTAEADVQALVQAVTEEYNTWAAQESAENAAENAEQNADAAAAQTDGSEDAAAEQNQENDSSAAEETPAEETAAEETPTEETAAEETPAEQAPAEETTRTAVILSDCFLRSEPGYNGQILRTVPAGTSVTVIGDIEKGWWHIRADDDGSYGYVGRGFIS